MVLCSHEKGVRKNDLYVLDRSTVTCSINVRTRFYNHKTRFWYMRLGNISLKGLKELNKYQVFGDDKTGLLGFCEEYVLDNSARVRFRSC